MDDSHGRFVWYELTATNPESARAFYAKVMGWNPGGSPMPGAYTVFTAGEVPVGGLMPLPESAREMGAKPLWLGYVRVDDLDAAADRVTELGGAIYVPPTEIPEVSRFAIITDPQMAMLGLVQWLTPHPEQPKPADSLGRVGWHELLAADWERAFAFYAALFGWQKSQANAGPLGTYQRFSASGETIGGVVAKPPKAVPFWLYYFNVADIDQTAARVVAQGGRVIFGPIDVPDGNSIAHCTDPEGAMFALVGKRSYKAKIFVEAPPSRDPLTWRKPTGD